MNVQFSPGNKVQHEIYGTGVFDAAGVDLLADRAWVVWDSDGRRAHVPLASLTLASTAGPTTMQDVYRRIEALEQRVDELEATLAAALVLLAATGKDER